MLRSPHLKQCVVIGADLFLFVHNLLQSLRTCSLSLRYLWQRFLPLFDARRAHFQFSVSSSQLRVCERTLCLLKCMAAGTGMRSYRPKSLPGADCVNCKGRSEEHTSELQSLA